MSAPQAASNVWEPCRCDWLPVCTRGVQLATQKRKYDCPPAVKCQYALAMFRLLVLSVVMLTQVLVQQTVAQVGTGAQATVTFNGTEFLHRWSKDGQHEFTPKGEDDLARWSSMVTINVHHGATTGDQLADVANRVLGNYQQAGKIIRTDSKPRTPKTEAEHLAVVMLPNPEFLEVAFARVLLHDGHGTVVVYSKRVYGAKAGNEMSAWLRQNGPDVEEALMAWTGIPSQAVLKALPTQ